MFRELFHVLSHPCAPHLCSPAPLPHSPPPQGRHPGQISSFAGPGWELPFQYRPLITIGHFRAWAPPRPDFPISGPCLGCVFLVQSSYCKWPFPGLGGSPARFRYFRHPAWNVPFQYKVLTTNGHFRAWAAPRPDIPISGCARPQQNICIFVHLNVLDRTQIYAYFCLLLNN